MRTPHTLAVVLVAPIALVACGSGSSGTPTTTSWPVVTTTSAPPPTSGVPGTDSTTSTSSTTTSTTTPTVVNLELSSEGLGEAVFGAGAEGVLAYVRAILGEATADSGWVDPASTGATCAGTEVRFVTWNDLVLTFGDSSPYAEGFQHFSGFTYGPAFGPQIDPHGLQTEGGIGVGDTVGDLETVYPGVTINDADEMSGPSFYIEEGLFGFLTGTGSDETIISFVGGAGCGE